MHLKKIVITGIFVTLLVTLFLLSSLYPHATQYNTLRISGTVEKIFQGETNRVVFKLKDDDYSYYIEPTPESTLTIQTLQKQLTGKPVEIYYVKSWLTQLSFRKFHHIAKVESPTTTL